MIPAPIERNYPKRLPRAGCWQMGLFQWSVDPPETLSQFTTAGKSPTNATPRGKGLELGQDIQMHPGAR